MPEMLASYVAGTWYTAPDAGTAVADAATGEIVARVSSTGLDTRAIVDHARQTGGHTLRQLTFHERAAALKTLATYLDANKAAYHELSLATGATRRDGTGDIDGGIGTVFAYSSRARRELPDGFLIPDGDVEAIGKGGTFAAGTCTRRFVVLPFRSTRSTSRCGGCSRSSPRHPRRRSHHRQTCDADRVRHRGGGARHHRVGSAAGRVGAAHLRQHG